MWFLRTLPCPSRVYERVASCEYFFPIEEVKRWIETVPDLRRGPLKLAKKGPGVRVESHSKSGKRKKK